MIDIHSHILWGVDDGARSFEQSLKMLTIAADSGTTDIVATPHANSEFSFNPRVIEAKLAKLREAVGDSIRIHNGCDFHLSYDNIEDALAKPAKYAINHRSYLLVEFSESMIPLTAGDIFDRLLDQGLTPIITHPERNQEIQKQTKRLLSWVEKGCLLQVTAQSLLGGFGDKAQSYAGRLLSKGLVSFIASDAHDCTHRPPRIDQAYTLVKKKMGLKIAECIFVENPRRVLQGNPIDQRGGKRTRSEPVPWYKLWI
jgi:protein-tyrosine phosphatase